MSLARLINWIGQLPIYIACFSLFSLMVLTFFDVILRSIFDAPIEAATELTRILVGLTVFSVLPILAANMKDGHIAVDLFDGFFDKYKLNRIRDTVTYIGCAILMIWPTLKVWKLTERTWDYGDLTEYLGIPQYWVMAGIAFFMTVSVLAMLVKGLALFFAATPTDSNQR